MRALSFLSLSLCYSRILNIGPQRRSGIFKLTRASLCDKQTPFLPFLLYNYDANEEAREFHEIIRRISRGYSVGSDDDDDDDVVIIRACILSLLYFFLSRVEACENFVRSHQLARQTKRRGKLYTYAWKYVDVIKILK